MVLVKITVSMLRTFIAIDPVSFLLYIALQ